VTVPAYCSGFVIEREKVIPLWGLNLHSKRRFLKFQHAKNKGAIMAGSIIQKRLDENKTENSDTQKSAEEARKYQQAVLQQRRTEQPVFKQPSEEKQNKGYHSPLRGFGKKMAIWGGVLGFLGGVLIGIPMEAFGLAGIGLAALGVSLVVIAGFTWVAGVIDEAIHNRHVPKAPDEKEEEQKKKKRKKGEEKEWQGQKQQPTQGNETQEEKDTQQK